MRVFGIALVLALLMVPAMAADVTFNDLKWEYKGSLYHYVTVNMGEYVKPHVYVHTLYSGDVILKIEYVEDVPLAPDRVVTYVIASAYAPSDDMDLEIVPLDPFTADKPGKYFARVYVWTGPTDEPEFVKAHANVADYWERIDPWQDPISNPGRPEVTYVEAQQPIGSLIDVSWQQFGREVDRIEAGQLAEVTVYVSVNNFVGGTVTLEVREDVPWGFDKLLMTGSKTVSQDGTITVSTAFSVPVEDSGIRGVFVKVYGTVNGQTVTIYDEADPNKRFSDGTEIEVVFEQPPVTPTPTWPTPTPTQPTWPTPTTPTYPYVAPTSNTLTYAAFAIALAAIIVALAVRRGA